MNNETKEYCCTLCGKRFTSENNEEEVFCPICDAEAKYITLSCRDTTLSCEDTIFSHEDESPYKGTQTEKNLMTAFLDEAAGMYKYTCFASQAKKDKFEQLAEVFQKTADNEKEHGKMWAEELGIFGDTVMNLRTAIEGEYHEWAEMYNDFAKTAEEEGFTELAKKFRMVADIEVSHWKRYKDFLNNIETLTMFDRDEVKVWVCRNCGHIHVGESAPDECPVCSHPRGFFELEATNY